jgi:hypothetical protein
MSQKTSPLLVCFVYWWSGGSVQKRGGFDRKSQRKSTAWISVDQRGSCERRTDKNSVPRSYADFGWFDLLHFIPLVQSERFRWNQSVLCFQFLCYSFNPQPTSTWLIQQEIN